MKLAFFYRIIVYDPAAFQIPITRFRFPWRWQRPGVFIVNFQHISYLFIVSVGDIEQVQFCWVTEINIQTKILSLKSGALQICMD